MGAKKKNASVAGVDAVEDDAAVDEPRVGYATLPKFKIVERLVDGMVRDPDKPGKMKPGKVVEKLMVPDATDVTFRELEDGSRVIIEPERLAGYPLPA